MIGSPRFGGRCVGIGACLAVAVMSACGQAASITTSAAANKNPVVVGVSLPSVGNLAGDGASLEQGYTVWADLVNRRGGILNRKVKLDIRHDDGSIAQVQANYEKLISSDHVSVVVGPFDDAPTTTAAAVAAKHGYVLLQPTGTAPGDFQLGLRNMFCVSLSASRYLTGFANYILSLPPDVRPKTAAYASSSVPFAQAQVQIGQRLLEQGGVQTVLSETYPSANPDLAGTGARVAKSGAEIFIQGTDAGSEMTPVLQVFRDRHYTPSAWVATSGPDQGAQFLASFGNKNVEGILVPNGSWYPAIKTSGNSEFVQRSLAMYGGSPDDIGSDNVQAYALGQVLEQVAAAAGSVDNAALLAQLQLGRTYRSVNGPVQFADDGENKAAVPFLFQWQQGHLIPVYPPGDAQALPEYPKPAWQ